MPPAPSSAIVPLVPSAVRRLRRAVIVVIFLAISGLPRSSIAGVLDFEAAMSASSPVSSNPPYAVDPRDMEFESASYPRQFLDQPPGIETILLAQIGEYDANWRTEAGLVSAPMYEPAPRTFGQMFLKAWVPVTAAEFALLGVTASLPKSWTGWSAHFVRDGVNHLGQAYTKPPVIDDDWWFHNYVGHPIGGSYYYNTVRSQGATPRQSMFFSAVLSTQWEYFFEAFAERPSIQDLIVTPVAGSILGELTHRLTMQLKKGGTTTGEKILILLTNPMHAAFAGF